MPVHKAPGTFRIFIMGESAAQGDPQPSYGAGRFLEGLLRERYPAAKFEVVNVAITAINSHVILPIARECARRDGDLWIVYMGNNEMVGPFGAATVFGSQAPPLPLVRLSLALQQTRLGQAMMQLGRRLRKNDAAPAHWAGMQMFMGHELRAHDPRRERGLSEFWGQLARHRAGWIGWRGEGRAQHRGSQLKGLPAVRVAGPGWAGGGIPSRPDAVGSDEFCGAPMNICRRRAMTTRCRSGQIRASTA